MPDWSDSNVFMSDWSESNVSCLTGQKGTYLCLIGQNVMYSWLIGQKGMYSYLIGQEVSGIVSWAANGCAKLWQCVLGGKHEVGPVTDLETHPV